MSIGAELGQYAYFANTIKRQLRVDSQMKLTLGQRISKSTHHVRQVDYLV